MDFEILAKTLERKLDTMTTNKGMATFWTEELIKIIKVWLEEEVKKHEVSR